MITPLSRRGWCAAISLAGLAAPACLMAGSLSLNFDDGQVPPEGIVVGSAVVEDSGGFAGGALKLVKNVNGLQGSFLIQDLDGGAPVNSVNATFKARVGGGTSPPADGWSFCVGNDLPETAWGEEGPATTGLIVAFDLYDNGGGEAPAITIRWNNTQIAEVKPPINALITGEAGTPAWADVQIQLESDGSLDVKFDGVTYIDNFYTPFEPIPGARVGFGARTGGLNMNVFIDDLSVTTTTGGLRAALVHQPQSATFLPGSRARFFALLANEAVATGFQWERKEPGGANFVPVPGATTRDFVSAAPMGAGDNGAAYRLAIADGQGTTLSNEATVTVSALAEPAYDYTANFDDGLAPPQSTLFGDALVDPAGFLQLTNAVEAMSGAMVINDLDAGASISAIFASFDLRMGSGGLPPADGFSFNWGLGMTAGTVADAEEGSGNGLRVCFDVYDNTDGNPTNGAGEAPTLDLKWGTTVLASVRVSPYEFFTDLDLVPVRVRLDATGAVTVAFNGRIYFQNVVVPSWTAVAGAQFGFYARTGGAFQKHEIDNVQLATTTYAGPVDITDEPQDLVGVTGQPATFTVAANYASPPATIQWQQRAPGAPDFSNIPGGTSFSLVTAPLTAANNGTLYRAIVSVGASSDTSREALLTVVDFGTPAGADVVLNFDNGDLTNTGSAAAAVIATYGNVPEIPAFTATGGVGDTGYLAVTEAATGQAGALVVENFSGPNAQGSLLVTFDVNLTGSGASVPAVPADGFSFNWADNAPAGVIGGAEDGAGTGLSITVDTYDSTDANPDNGVGEAPAIGIKFRGVYVVPEIMVPRAFIQPMDWVKFGVRVENDGTIDVLFNNVVLFHNVTLPNWTGLANGRFNLAGRTGGAVQTHWFDNLVINTSNYIGPISLTQQPADIGVIAGTPAAFTAVINDPGQTAWQWQSAPAGSATFTNIPGATTDSYTTPATTLADNGRQYRVIATGLNNTVTSEIAVLTVIDPQLPPPTAQIDWDSPSPLTYAFAGSGAEGIGDGVGGSAFASLTTAVNDQNGMLVIDDFNDGQPVNSIVAAWDMRIGGGSSPPADGLSFVWGDDVGNSTAPSQFGEEGSGNGLIVSFDTYENGNGDVPGISLKWQGALLAEKPMPFAAFLSDPEYFPVVVRLDADGTADVLFNNEVIFYNVTVPGFSSLRNASFVWGARTGGANQNNYLDNIRLTTTLEAPPSTDTINIAVSGGNLVITYTGTLQSSLTMGTGSWQNVAGASSPYTIPLPTSGALYFRAGR
jgi:hypothetical protein